MYTPNNDMAFVTGLMENAKPEESALKFYCYDNDGIRTSTIFIKDTIQEILDGLNAVKAYEIIDWSLDDISLPIYGFEIKGKNNWLMSVAWTNGVWITQDGKAYTFDYDFKNLEQSYFRNSNKLSCFSFFPCSRLLTQNEKGWNSSLLSPAEMLNPPHDVTVSYNSHNTDTISVNYMNNSGSEWLYGEGFRLQVLLNDIWYNICATLKRVFQRNTTTIHATALFATHSEDFA